MKIHTIDNDAISLTLAFTVYGVVGHKLEITVQ